MIGGHGPDVNGYCRECTIGRWWHRRHVPYRVYLLCRRALDAHHPDPVQPLKHRADR